MNISKLKIEEALRKEDIEDLLSSGAPADEYTSEAATIAAAVSALPHSQLNEQGVVAVISMVWEQAFGRTAQEIELRLPSFTRVAKAILCQQ